MNNTNELVLVAHNLPENKLQSLLNSYADSFTKAKEVVERVKDIVVTSEDQVEKMKMARKARLELKDIRVHVENTRVELKEQSLREGKAIDGMANIIKALIVPVEEHLEKQEKFIEEQKKMHEEDELNRRTDMLTPYVPDISVYSLHPKLMSNETFDKLLEDSKKAWQAQKDAEKRAEEERLAKAEADRIENERIRKENEKLKEMNRVKNEKLRLEREKNEESERKLREARLAEELKKKQDEEAKHKALMAPDEEKLMKLADTINAIELPTVSSGKAIEVLQALGSSLDRIVFTLRKEAKNL